MLKRYANAQGYIIVDIITDVGSGLKEERKGLKKLMRMVTDGRIDVVHITYRDRLTRFGYKYLQFFFKEHGVGIEEILHEEKEH